METILSKLTEAFPDEHFEAVSADKKPKKKPVAKSQKTTLSSATDDFKLSSKKKNLPLKQVLKDIKLDDDDIDFTKLFKK